MTENELRQKLVDLIHKATLDVELGIADFLLADVMIDAVNEYRVTE